MKPKNFICRLYNASGIHEINVTPEIHAGSIINEIDVLTQIETETETEAQFGDILNISLLSENGAKYLTLIYIINDTFMGSYELSFIGYRKGEIY